MIAGAVYYFVLFVFCLFATWRYLCSGRYNHHELVIIIHVSVVCCVVQTVIFIVFVTVIYGLFVFFGAV